ncbi:MAG TPA: Arm DNA-binding domain-containing protein, partial [Stellaceae bacterium]|nr:Arm DNA-binding domain-containing protein [Stellaceae bacterium]
MANRVEKFTSEFVMGYQVPKSGRVRVWETATPGLCLQVTCGGARSFIAVYRLMGDERRATLGPATMKLSEARKLTLDYREAARQGRDPLGGRPAAQVRRGGIKLGDLSHSNWTVARSRRDLRGRTRRRRMSHDRVHIDPRMR